jgi:hypothetical protein
MIVFLHLHGLIFELPCSQELAPLTRPIGQPLQGSHAIKRRGRNVRRSQLVCFSWIYELTDARRAPLRVRTRVETRRESSSCGPEGPPHHLSALGTRLWPLPPTLPAYA